VPVISPGSLNTVGRELEGSEDDLLGPRPWAVFNSMAALGFLWNAADVLAVEDAESSGNRSRLGKVWGKKP